MNYLGVHLAPDLVKESWQELERQRERERQIRERTIALRAERPSRFATLAARLRPRLRPARRPEGNPIAEGC